MYTKHFGFTKNPFNLATEVSNFCHDDNKRELVERIIQNLKTDIKPIVLTGVNGIGKTLLIKYLQLTLSTHFECLYLADNAVTYTTRLHELISRLKVTQESSNAKPLAILDNAHEIPLDVLQLLLVDAMGKSPFQLMLVGLPDLTNRLYSIDRDFFSDQKSHSYRIISLTDQQVKAYITFRLNQVGYCEKTQDPLFTQAALRIITELSQGIPHTINLLCGAALLIASFENKNQVSAEIAQEAILSCLLPAEITEEKIVALFNNSHLIQTKVYVNTAKRLTNSRRQSYHRIKNWKRIANIHYQLPVSSTDISPPPDELVKASRKRLKNGIAILGFSLCFLMGLQHMDGFKPTIQQSLLNLPNPVQSLSYEKQQWVSLEIQGEGTNRIAPMYFNQGLPKQFSSPISDDQLTVAKAESVDKPVVPEAKSAPNQALVQRALALPNQVANTDNHKTRSKVVPLAANTVESEGLLISSKKYLSRPIPKLKPDHIIVLAKNNSGSLSTSEKSPVYAHVNANIFSESVSNPSKLIVQPMKTVLDAEELAAKNRAASRLTLYRLGIDYNADSLVAAAQKGNVHVIKLFITSGMPPDLKNRQGETALIKAASKGYKEAVKELLDAGAHPNTKDNNGLTALMHANQNNRPFVKNLLLSRGTKD